MLIRSSTENDLAAIRDVHLAAFPEGERGVVSGLAVELLSEPTTPSALSLIAEVDGAIVGHVVFSPVIAADGGAYLGHILAPLGVRPEFQSRGIGSGLVDHGIGLLREAGAELLFVYGDPAYYGRFGFDADIAARYVPPCPLQYPFGWLGLALGEVDTTGPPIKIDCVPALRDPTLW